MRRFTIHEYDDSYMLSINNDVIVYLCPGEFKPFMKANKLRVDTPYSILTFRRVLKNQISKGRHIGLCHDVISTVSENLTKEEEKESFRVYKMLQNKEIDPTGKFDGLRIWNTKNRTLIPTHVYHPHSQMKACRTLDYVKRCAALFGAKNLQDNV